MKFFFRLAAGNIVRHKYKSILHVLIGVLTVLILDIYAGNLDSQPQAADIRQSVSVR